MDRNFEDLVALCMRLGSPQKQAETMARQLLKRSEQLAAERNIKQVEALDYLLKLMISGRQGVVWTDTASEGASKGADELKKRDSK